MNGSVVPRLMPHELMPPYSYVPGKFPHPTRDPSGHSFGHATAQPPPVDPQRWDTSQAYLRGCDLFNHGYYWEAHEVWEGLWHAWGRHGATADFLKGLIKLAAAGVKVREGRPRGVARHAARAAELFQQVHTEIGSTSYLGLDVPRLIEIAREQRTHLITPEPTDAPVHIVFDFRLLPEPT